MPVGLLYVFLEKMSIQILCPFLNQAFCCWVLWVLYIFWMLMPYLILDLQMSSPVGGCLFLVLMVSFACKSIWVWCGAGGLVAKSCPTLATSWTVTCQAPLSMGFSRQEYWKFIFVFVSFPWRDVSRNLLLRPVSKSVMSVFFPGVSWFQVLHSIL